MPSRLCSALVVVAIAMGVRASASFTEIDWTRFRGPNGSGISVASGIPTDFGPASNVAWKVALPPGHSSPILWRDRIYLTGFREKTLVTFAIDRLKGQIVWEKNAPTVNPVVPDKRNNPASPSPAVDDTGVYVFFPDYGLIAYELDGRERWKLPLGPFNNVYGMGASPIVVGSQVILPCDQSIGSFLLSVDAKTGKEKWRTPRPEAKSGHATPILWKGPDGRDQLLLAGSFRLTAYDVQSGEPRWFARGLSFEIKSTPVILGDTVFINGYGAPENEPGKKIIVPPASEVWPQYDTDKNGELSQTEFPKFSAAFWFDYMDLDRNHALSKSEWDYYRAALDSENGMLAIKLGGKGDTTVSAIQWKYHRSVPQLPSPLVYKDVLYMVNDNCIVTTLNPKNGEVIKQGRPVGAGAVSGGCYASPVAADGHIFITSERGVVAVLDPGGDLTPIKTNELKEDAYATPAFADGRIYIRTVAALYAFGK